MKIDKAIFEFLDNSKRFKSFKMWEMESLALKRASAFFNNLKICDIKKIKAKDVHAWIDHMKVNHIDYKALSAKSINEYVRVFKAFLKYYKIINDIQHIPKLKHVKKIREIVPDNTLMMIVEHLKLLDLDYQNNLLRTSLFYVLLFTGARADELVKLVKDDVDLENQFLILRKTKGQVERIVPFSSTAKKYLALMIESHSYDYVFYNSLQKRQAVYNDVRYLFKYLREIIGIKKLSAHMLRHTFATKLVDNDADMSVVQEILGHSDIRTTQIYARISIKRIQSTYDRTANFVGLY